MKESWDFYTCDIDDAPASIFLNMGLEESCPVASHPICATFQFDILNPTEDGFNTSEEAAKLFEIEDAIVPVVTKDGTWIFVGRTTTQGARELFFYGPSLDIWEDICEPIMDQFEEYGFSCSEQEDPQWELYQEFLLPQEWDRELMKNRKVCQQLQSQGDLLTKPRAIDHWIDIPEDSKLKFQEFAQENGFTIVDSESSIHLTKVESPDLYEISETTFTLSQQAKELGGSYDGWGCSVEK